MNINKNHFFQGIGVLSFILCLGLLLQSSTVTHTKTTPTSTVSYEPFIGEISMFAGNFAPRGWAFCDGQLLPINQNQALFSILGTTYGGDGRTTFGLPDLRGRVSIHAGQGPGLTDRRLGAKGGEETSRLNLNNLPSHDFRLVGKTTIGEGYGGKVSPVKFKEDTNGTTGYAIENDAPLEIDNTKMATQSKGSEQAFNNMPPYQTVNYIIAIQGTFPSRY